MFLWVSHVIQLKGQGPALSHSFWDLPLDLDECWFTSLCSG